MNNKSTFVYYQVGAYGTFVEWCLNYFTNQEFPEDLPFLKDGSAHNSTNGNFIWNTTEFDQYIQSEIPTFTRAHPGAINKLSVDLLQLPNSYEQLLSIELKDLEDSFDNIIFLYYSVDSWIWGTNNQIEKASLTTVFQMDQCLELLSQKGILKKKIIYNPHPGVEHIRIMLDYNGASEYNNTMEGKSSILDKLEIWNLRELLSLYFPQDKLHVSHNQIFNNIKNKFPNILMFDILDLKNNFREILKKCISKTNQSMIREEKIDEIYSIWITSQVHNDKDALIQNIVHCLANNIEFNWSPLTLIDESFLQYYLRLKDIEIRCWELNQFPTNTKDFLPLLERV